MPTIGTLKTLFHEKHLVNPNDFIKCKKCKLVRRRWQLQYAEKQRIYGINNVWQLTIKCPNCNAKELVKVAVADNQFKVCSFNTYDDCFESVAFNHELIKYVPEDLLDQEIEFISKI